MVWRLGGSATGSSWWCFKASMKASSGVAEMSASSRPGGSRARSDWSSSPVVRHAVEARAIAARRGAGGLKSYDGHGGHDGHGNLACPVLKTAPGASDGAVAPPSPASSSSRCARATAGVQRQLAQQPEEDGARAKASYPRPTRGLKKLHATRLLPSRRACRRACGGCCCSPHRGCAASLAARCHSSALPARRPRARGHCSGSRSRRAT